MPASQRTQRKRPADHTGVQMQRQAKDNSEAIKERAAELGMIQAQIDDERTNEVVDLTGSQEPAPVAEVKPIEVSRPDRTIRVVCDIEEMTFGRQVIPGSEEQGTVARAGSLQTYSFEEGRQYKVPWDVAEHLQKLGYLH